MTTAQGEFATESDAARAVEALVSAGVPAARIRKWNIIPERPASAPRASSVGRSTAVGYLLGGVGGAALGATLGAAKDAMSATQPPMPDPSGVRVVVETAGAEPDVRKILLECGAANIR
jgi:hypothetical protein